MTTRDNAIEVRRIMTYQCIHGKHNRYCLTGRVTASSHYKPIGSLPKLCPKFEAITVTEGGIHVASPANSIVSPLHSHVTPSSEVCAIVKSPVSAKPSDFQPRCLRNNAPFRHPRSSHAPRILQMVCTFQCLHMLAIFSGCCYLYPTANKTALCLSFTASSRTIEAPRYHKTSAHVMYSCAFLYCIPMSTQRLPTQLWSFSEALPRTQIFFRSLGCRSSTLLVLRRSIAILRSSEVAQFSVEANVRAPERI